MANAYSHLHNYAQDLYTPHFDLIGQVLQYKQGKLDGTSMEYYPDGQIKSEFIFVAGQRQGIQHQYHANGNLKSIWSYQNDMKHGTNKMFFENGDLLGAWDYKEGKKIGEPILFSASSQQGLRNT